jgi:hypothetical protein
MTGHRHGINSWKQRIQVYCGRKGYGGVRLAGSQCLRADDDTPAGCVMGLSGFCPRESETALASPGNRSDRWVGAVGGGISKTQSCWSYLVLQRLICRGECHDRIERIFCSRGADHHVGPAALLVVTEGGGCWWVRGDSAFRMVDCDRCDKLAAVLGRNRRLTPGRFSIFMIFLDLRRSDGSSLRLGDFDCWQATCFPEGVNRIDSGKLKLCDP